MSNNSDMIDHSHHHKHSHHTDFHGLWNNLLVHIWMPKPESALFDPDLTLSRVLWVLFAMTAHVATVNQSHGTLLQCHCSPALQAALAPLKAMLHMLYQCNSW